MTPLTITFTRSWDGSWSFGWQTERSIKGWRSGYRDYAHARRACKQSMIEQGAWQCETCGKALYDDGTCTHCQKMRDLYPAKAEMP